MRVPLAVMLADSTIGKSCRQSEERVGGDKLRILMLGQTGIVDVNGQPCLGPCNELVDLTGKLRAVILGGLNNVGP